METPLSPDIGCFSDVYYPWGSHSGQDHGETSRGQWRYTGRRGKLYCVQQYHYIHQCFDDGQLMSKKCR